MNLFENLMKTKELFHSKMDAQSYFVRRVADEMQYVHLL